MLLKLALKKTLCLIIFFNIHSICLANQEKGGIKVNYTKVVVENLPIGQKISLSKIANYPLKITNKFKRPLDMVLSVIKPQETWDDFLPVPEVSWIKLQQELVTVPAQTTCELEVNIILPDDEKLLGKKFQANIVVRTSNKNSTVGYEVTGFLLFTLAPKRNDKALALALQSPLDSKFTLVPSRLDIYKVIPGQVIEVKHSEGDWVKLNNKISQTREYVVKAVSVAGTAVVPDKGSQLGNKADIILETEKIRLLSDQNSKDLKIKIKVPSEVVLSQGPLFYLVAISPDTQQKVEKFLKIYLWGGDSK